MKKPRQKAIAAVIRSNGGAVVGEQIAPYLDDISSGYAQKYEDYMLPVLTRFNGQPTVSPQGHLVYVFPELQATAASEQQEVFTQHFLQEIPQKFSAASPGAIAYGSAGSNRTKCNPWNAQFSWSSLPGKLISKRDYGEWQRFTFGS
ncbi:hypothetical protein [Chlorogloea sp. CCALA 695]|uniref:hypothetical protein n=1 Tax=Chlorogloea sp. CCALA 695 TaxID=2107693 RepID=UPI000D06CD35|nr:hypothetical protein [Chlorogloea sp. CCALA 695]PSB26560.1 hypothetical protein C7B70_23645 [Chlorogloea sp. CCALA 695]